MKLRVYAELFVVCSNRTDLSRIIYKCILIERGLCILNYECYEETMVLAIASVPMQKWRLTYSPEKALCEGTMFAELNLPFKGGCKR